MNGLMQPSISRKPLLPLPCRCVSVLAVKTCTIWTNHEYRACLVVFQVHLELLPGPPLMTFEYVPTAFLTYLIPVYFYQLVLVYNTIDKSNASQAIGLIALNVFISSYIGVSLKPFRDAILELGEDDYTRKDVWFTPRHLMIANLTVGALSTIGNLGFVYIMHFKPFEGMIRRRKAAAIEPRTLYSSYLVSLSYAICLDPRQLITIRL